jgi:hypothetical protein
MESLAHAANVRRSRAAARRISSNSREAMREGNRGNAASKTRSALASLEAGLLLVDHIDPALTAHEPVVAVTTAQ